MAESSFRVDEALRKEFEEARRCYKINEVNTFCILCRTNKPEIKREPPYPLILNSVWKSEEMKLSSIGTEVEEGFDISRLYYRGYCKECKEMLSRGEQCFDQFVYTPLIKDYDRAVHVEGDNVVDVYHCALSVWWRFASLSGLACEESNEGKAHRRLLESVRVWLHRRRKFFPFGVWVFLTAIHPENMAHLKKIALGTPAIGCYTNKDTWFIPLGPLLCWFKFMKVLAEIPNCLHIGEGMTRLHLSKECVEKHMANVDDEQRRREFEVARACLVHNKRNQFCILCRRKNPGKVQLSHIIPHSVLKSAKGLHSIGPTGTEVGPSNLGYRGYCKQCEEMLSNKGERNFDKLMHKPLVENYRSDVRVEGDEVDRVYHCALSVWWRFESLWSEWACEESPKGTAFRKLLKSVREWLHKPNKSFPAGLQVGFIAVDPDCIQCLHKLKLEKAATGVYYRFLDECKRTGYVHMGPLICRYFFAKVAKDSKLPSDARVVRLPLKQDVIEYLKHVKEFMLSTEFRVSGQKEFSSNDFERIQTQTIDLIPPGKVILFDKTTPNHRHIRQIVFGQIQLDLYKPKRKEDGDGPPYEGMVSIPTEDKGLVRVWLQSDNTGSTFEIHKDALLYKYKMTEANFQVIKQVVAKLHS